MQGRISGEPDARDAAGTGNALQIRPLTPADLPTCATMYCRAYDLPCYDGSWDEATGREIIADVLRLFPEHCFVAERDGVLQGFILCSSLAGVRATIEEFVVAPECQAQGVGSALLDYIMAHCRELGLPVIELVANRRAPAYAFYRKRGFEENRHYRLMSRPL